MQRILIVDDNDENIYYLYALLRSAGYVVETARNGVEALDAALADPPELVISDLLMPIMDGFTLLRQWKLNQQLNRIPFVVYTATYTDPKDEQLALDLGADAFIVKPTEPDPFMARIREVLAKAVRGDMSPTNAPVGEEADLLRQYSEVLIHKLESKALELEEANRTLSAREAHLRAIIENSPNCITSIASDGTFLTMNEAGLRMMEADNAAMVVGQSSYHAVVPESRNAFRDLTERVCRGESGMIECEFVGLKGTRRWLELHAAPLKKLAENSTVLLGIALDTTNRKRAESVLQATLHRFYAILSNLYTGVLLVTDEGKVEFANQAFCNFFCPEDAPDALMGLNDINVIKKIKEVFLNHDESVARIREIVNEGNLVLGEEISLRTGKVLLRDFVPLTVDGKSYGRLWVHTDITENKRAEELIRRLNRVYSVLSDINQTLIRETDSQAILEAACRIAVEKGKFRMAWVGMADPATGALIPIASSGVAEDYLKQVRIDLEDTKTVTGPATYCFHSGEHQFCNDIEHEFNRPWKDYALQLGCRSLASFPLRCENRVVGVFNLYARELAFFDEEEAKLLDEVAMDISFALEVNRREKDRVKKEEELRWRTAFFEAQVDAALDGVLVVDSHGRKILQNQRMNDLMNIPREVVEDPNDARQVQFVRSIVKNPEQFVEKVNYLNSHAEEISHDEIELLNGTIFNRYSAPVQDKLNNYYYGRIWTFRDITQRRQLEEQLRQAQKMEAVGQLTGGIAHDFNNLLTVILGCSEFIGEETQENPRLSKMVKMIVDAAQRGADLTHRMLAFARRQALQPKPVDINQMLANMERFLRRTLSADIDLEVIRSREDCTALVDLTQLESALLNLCVNARDAMPGGGKLIVETGIATLDSSYAEQNPDVVPGQYILIAVSDTGCGIAPENLSRVFDPFFTTKEVGKGTGLGLSMVYGFVKQSKGHVKIYSEPEQGTSVKLYLPQAGPECEPPSQEATLIADLHGSEVILLVEDNEPVREFAKAQLHYLGYRVLEAANGIEALAILREHRDVDLLFTDVVMPGGLNGRELALEARKLYPALKVLFCSGYAESAILHLGLLDEDVQLLNKPYSRLQLARRIRGILTASQSAPEEEGGNA
jgi:PAS domain S-box-containing protein